MSLAAEYLETQVMTATPHRLHLMVVDAALRNTRRGIEMLAAEEWEELDRALGKARECVAELISGLNPEMAPELVESFRGLFGFVYRSLTVGDLERDSKTLLDAMRILLLHRDNWVALGERLMQETATPPAGTSTFAEPSAVPAPHGRSWSA
ncbi:MAG TPA: flagellar export chaperone FliS [Planctomycetaceae bacterium]|nr:flagellar export chaperone FliS [Planctomycetaceae bacterium]